MRLRMSGSEDDRQIAGFLSADFWKDQELLDIVDAILALGGPWPSDQEVMALPPHQQTAGYAKAKAIQGLEQMLALANSVYTVNGSRRRPGGRIGDQFRRDESGCRIRRRPPAQSVGRCPCAGSRASHRLQRGHQGGG